MNWPLEYSSMYITHQASHIDTATCGLTMSCSCGVVSSSVSQHISGSLCKAGVDLSPAWRVSAHHLLLLTAWPEQLTVARSPRREVVCLKSVFILSCLGRLSRKKSLQRTADCKAHISMETGFALATQHKWNQHKKHEMYIANNSPSHWGPNATYIPPARVGGWLWG